MANRKQLNMSQRIWRIMLIALSIVMVVFIIVNLTLISKIKADFMYEQLEEAAQVKRSNSGQKDDEDRIDELLVPHFLVVFQGDEPIIEINPYTRKLYENKDGEGGSSVLTSIVEELSSVGWDAGNGKLSVDGQRLYYHVDKDFQSFDDKDSYMVYFVEDRVDSRGLAAFVMVIAMLLGFTYIVSKIVAKVLSKPLLKIEKFAGEVSNKNWDAEVPTTNTAEITSLINSLDQMKIKLKDAEEKDRKFLQHASHDLKTPVMVIKGYTQALIDKVGFTSRDEALQVINGETERLEHRIQQLLRLNTLNHLLDRQEKEILRIDRMLKSIVKRYLSVNPNLLIDSDLEEVEILANQEALMIALENLMDNQIRYAKSRIRLTLKKEDKVLHLIISNDGEHLSMEPSKLFDHYQKSSDGNFGLGLAIVKQVINGHGGIIKAENMENGVAFKVEIPLD